MTLKARAFVALGMLACGYVLAGVGDLITALLAYGFAMVIALGALSN